MLSNFDMYVTYKFFDLLWNMSKLSNYVTISLLRQQAIRFTADFDLTIRER